MVLERLELLVCQVQQDPQDQVGLLERLGNKVNEVPLDQLEELAQEDLQDLEE